LGSILLAVFALGLPEIGGVSGLAAQLPETTFRFIPVFGRETAEAAGVLVLSVPALVAFIGVQWWASWYPGAEPGGGGYIAQRMMSARDEKNSVFAVLWFTLAHYCLRPWPWILTALAALVILPQLTATERAAVQKDPVVAQAAVASLPPLTATEPAPARKAPAVAKAYKHASAGKPAPGQPEAYNLAYALAKQQFAAASAFRDRYENAIANPGGMSPKMMRD